MRDFKQEHTRRQQLKKRLIFEVDRQQYEKLTTEQQRLLSQKLRDVIKNELQSENGGVEYDES